MGKLIRVVIALASLTVLCPAQDEVALRAVMVAGKSTMSFPEQRVAIHRATQSLIELAMEQKQYMQAAGYGMIQRTNYRNLDQDYEAALKASELALEHQNSSGLSKHSICSMRTRAATTSR
jgi:hypothetical protein